MLDGILSLSFIVNFNTNLSLNNNEIFDEFTHVKKNYACAEEIEIWKHSTLKPDKKWVGNLKFFEQKYSL